ncbi:MAG: hypothetical protein HFF30_03150 [Flavonifractor sp.]|jgi:hypothetical protein|nr:hypothetical protein [Flavonifractor sp.]MCI9473210.1 hypothetical protein [Flavonifractor sp.]
MGRFDRLAAPVWKSQEQVREDIASIVNEINQKKIKDAVEAVYIKLKKLDSSSEKTYVLRALQEKASISDTDEVYQAFEHIYQRYRYQGDAVSFELSQILGKSLR